MLNFKKLVFLEMSTSENVGLVITFHWYDEDWKEFAKIDRKEDTKHKITKLVVTPYLPTLAERQVGSEDGQVRIYTFTIICVIEKYIIVLPVDSFQYSFILAT